MRNIFLLLFISASFITKAATPLFSKDSLPPWKQFKKLSKTELLELYRDDAGAVNIIKYQGKREKGLLFVAGGLAVFSVLLFILGDIITIGGPALISLFGYLLLGILFLTASTVALTILITYFTGKKRRRYHQLKKYFQSKQ
jgi:hypothetical protein